MSEKTAQDASGESSEARVKSAFLRLGVTLDDDNGGDSDLVIAALNGAADRMDVLIVERGALASDIAQITAMLEAAGYAVIKGGTAVDRIEAALARLGDVEKSYADLLPDYDTVLAERDSLKRQLASQKGQTTQARAAAAALEARVPAEPRTFTAPDKPLSNSELLELLDDADDISLAFVGEDGVEVAGMAPHTLTGDAFRIAANGLRLRVPSLRVHGPAQGERPRALAGYALLVDGELAALSKRNEILRLAAGTTFELKDDVSFA